MVKTSCGPRYYGIQVSVETVDCVKVDKSISLIHKLRYTKELVAFGNKKRAGLDVGDAKKAK